MVSESAREILFSVLEKALQKPVDRSTIRDDMRLKEDLNMDSLSMLDAVWDVEDKFGVRITEEEMAQIKTVGDIFARIQRAEEEKTRGVAAVNS